MMTSENFIVTQHNGLVSVYSEHNVFLCSVPSNLLKNSLEKVFGHFKSEKKLTHYLSHCRATDNYPNMHKHIRTVCIHEFDSIIDSVCNEFSDNVKPHVRLLRIPKRKRMKLL